LSQIKAPLWAVWHSHAMDDQKDETIYEIERLRVLADWYRGWANVSGSEKERAARLGIAEHIETQARALRVLENDG